MKYKKIIITILAVCVLIVFIAKLQSSNTVSNEASSNADLTFAVLGDVHNNNDKFQDAINELYNINPKMDALILNGDTVDQGTDEKYKDMEKFLNKNKKKLPDTIIKNIGNHEFYDYDAESNTKEDMENRINKYLKFSGNEKVYHDTWIKDYHFISLGSEDNSSEKVNSTNAYISKEQLSWLKETLAENYKPGKPIFLFLHQPLEIDFFGSKGPRVVQSNEIKEIISKYPEVILFASHTHMMLDENLNINTPFISINTGAVSYTMYKDENSENKLKKDYSYNNGLYIEVIGNNVTIKGRDMKNHTWSFTKEVPD